jgi:hypothetical protein
VQKFLNIVGEHLEKEEESKHQAVAVLGIAAVALSEPLGSAMALRTFNNMLQYCEVISLFRFFFVVEMIQRWFRGVRFRWRSA